MEGWEYIYVCVCVCVCVHDWQRSTLWMSGKVAISFLFILWPALCNSLEGLN